MAKIERFEDIKAWQLARELVGELYRHSRKEMFVKDYGLKDQILRSSVSVMANIAEGFERYSNKEFVQFLSISRASCGEVRSHLYVAYDLNYLSEDEFKGLKDLSENISRHLWNFMKYLKTGPRT